MIKIQTDQFGKFVQAKLDITIKAYLNKDDNRTEVSEDEISYLLEREKDSLASSNDGSELIANANIVFEKNIQKILLEDFNQNLQKFLKKEIKSFGSYLSLDASIKEMSKHGFVDQPDMFDSNGWQWDFWNYMIHPELGKICLGGSGYYSNITISFDS